MTQVVGCDVVVVGDPVVGRCPGTAEHAFGVHRGQVTRPRTVGPAVEDVVGVFGGVLLALEHPAHVSPAARAHGRFTGEVLLVVRGREPLPDDQATIAAA